MEKNLNEIVEVDNTINPPAFRQEDFYGMIQTVATIPTVTPSNAFNQIQIYISGGTKKLYIYDTSTNTWLSATIA